MIRVDETNKSEGNAIQRLSEASHTYRRAIAPFRTLVSIASVLSVVMAVVLAVGPSTALAQDSEDEIPSVPEVANSINDAGDMEAGSIPDFPEDPSADPNGPGEVPPTQGHNTLPKDGAPQSPTPGESEDAPTLDVSSSFGESAPAARAMRANTPSVELLNNGPVDPVDLGNRQNRYQLPVKKAAQLTQVDLVGDFYLTQDVFNYYQNYFTAYIGTREVVDARWEWDSTDSSTGKIGHISLYFSAETKVKPTDVLTLQLPNWVFYRQMQMNIFGVVDNSYVVPDNPRLIGGNWLEKDRVKNPPRPERCGLNIAFVFDLSNSVGENGLENTKTAGVELMDALSGTPTKVGIFNFGTEAPVANTKDYPSLNLADKNDVDTAKKVIGEFDYGDHFPDDAYTDRGGTNWEGGLNNVLNSGYKYDIVYFITDGVPTTNIAHEPMSEFIQNQGDTGAIPHNQDISKAIDKANLIKSSGTRIEVLAVGDFEAEIPVLFDDVRFGGVAGWSGNGALLFPYHKVYPKQYISVNKFRPDLTPYFQDRVSAGVYGTFAPSQRANPWYFRLEDEMTSTSMGYTYSEDVWFYERNGNYTYERVEDLRYVPHYSNGRQTLESISGAEDEDFHLISDYGKLPKMLFELATASCRSALTVEKQIVDSDGNVLTVKDAEGNVIGNEGVRGWEFTAGNKSGDLLIAAGDGGEDLVQTTGSSGMVNYLFKSNSNTATGTISVHETQQPGYALSKQGDKNATCTEVEVSADSNGEKRNLDVKNLGELGFDVNVETGKFIHCVVQNTRNSTTFRVEKTPHDDQDKVKDAIQPKAPVRANGEVTAFYDIKVTNNTEFASNVESPIVDTVRYPADTAITKVELTYPANATVDVVRPVEGGVNVWEFELDSNKLGKFGPHESKTVQVAVTSILGATSISELRNGDYQKCSSANPVDTANASSLFNGVTLEGEVDGPNPKFNNQACVDPELSVVNFTVKKVDGDNNNEPLEGALFTIYQGDINNPETWTEVSPMQPKAGDPSTLTLPAGKSFLAGQYLLVETKAPKGPDGRQYSLLPRPIPINVSSIAGKTHVEIPLNDPSVTVDNSDASIIQVSNIHVGNLPKTGGSGILPYLIAALLLIGSSIAYRRRFA